MRRLRLTAIVLVLMLATASISVKMPRQLDVVDTAGTPMHPAYVAYSYVGSRLNPVVSLTYRAGRLILTRSEPAGRVEIPAVFHVHKPFPFETHPSLRVEFVYVPRLHNATGRMQDGRALVEDLTDKPELWQVSLANIASMIRRLTTPSDAEPPLRDMDKDAAALVRELIEHFRQEYDAFLQRYRDTPRPPSHMPEHIRLSSAEEQRHWRASHDAHLAREPLWGMLVTRLFEGQMELFARRERDLR